MAGSDLRSSFRPENRSRYSLAWRAPVLAITCLLPAACDSQSHPVYQVGNNVKIEVGAANWFSDDLRTSVVTDLYPYSRSSDPNSRYVITGPPLSFAFAKATYASYVNGKGGPQASVELRLDRNTFQPFAELLRQEGLATYERTGSNTEHLKSRMLSVGIYSNYLTPPVADLKSFWPVNVDRSQRVRVCGFDFYKAALNFDIYKNLEKPKIGDVTVEFATYRGIKTEESTSARIAECTVGSPICIVSFDYRGRLVHFDIPRGEFCKQESYIRGITNILERHRVERAP